MWDTVFDKIGLDFYFKKSALKWIEMWGALFDRIGLDFNLKKSGYEFWIACLISFDLTFVKGSYWENLIEIHRISGEKLI